MHFTTAAIIVGDGTTTASKSRIFSWHKSAASKNLVEHWLGLSKGTKANKQRSIEASPRIKAQKARIIPWLWIISDAIWSYFQRLRTKLENSTICFDFWTDCGVSRRWDQIRPNLKPKGNQLVHKNKSRWRRDCGTNRSFCQSRVSRDIERGQQ